jgi:hypothetical protein
MSSSNFKRDSSEDEEQENPCPPSHQGRPKESDDEHEHGALNDSGGTFECGCCVNDILVTEMVHCCGADAFFDPR